MILSKANLKKWSGFSLIELMIVIAIIGILAAVAVPAYQGYIIKAKVSELMEAANIFKMAVTEYSQTISTSTAAYPNSNSAAGLAPPLDATWVVPTTGKITRAYVDSAGTGTIVIQGNESRLGIPSPNLFYIMLIPTPASGAATTGTISWECRSATLATGLIGSPYAPSTCRTAYGAGVPTAPAT